MHIHASALGFLIFLAQLIIAGFFLRVVETRWPDSTVSKALAFIH